MDNKDIQRKAFTSFNKTWDLIDKSNRTAEENLKMIDLAFQSKYYWSLIGSELNFVRSDWQISRVFAEAKLLEASLFYANKCLEDTLKYDFKGFDLFFAYESNVRVYHLLKNYNKRDEFVELANKSLDEIEKKSDRDYCKSEIEKILEL